MIRKLTYPLTVLLFVSFAVNGQSRISGEVKDMTGNPVAGVSITFRQGANSYAATSQSDGSYVIENAGLDDARSNGITISQNYPNPFGGQTAIPVRITRKGNLILTVFNLTGQMIFEKSYGIITPGSYDLVWSGHKQNNEPVRPGVYVYLIRFDGKSYSGKMVKAEGFDSYNPGDNVVMGTDLQEGPVKSAQSVAATSFSAEVEKEGYYKIVRTQVNIRQDTVINFTLAGKYAVPFKTQGNYLAYWDYSKYQSVFTKGINLGSSPPGYWPGEIAYAISAEQYERWINKIGETGFNTIRVYTLHPPVFYQTLVNYNETHPNKPIYLFQGVWLEEVNTDNRRNPAEWDLFNHTVSFRNEMEEVVDCVHGNKSIAERRGKAYGTYQTDASRWIIGYIIGREMSPSEVDSTNAHHSSATSYSGIKIGISGVTPTEAWITSQIDHLVTYEKNSYGMERPISFSNWPTLDPLTHPTEIITDEDVAWFDLNNLDLSNAPAGYFASYHAYPYFPDFINYDPGYRKESDNYGPNSYLGFLKDLKNHYDKIPLLIGEFGVPSCWGSAHQSYSGMHHGGLTEEQQGTYNIRMMQNIKEANCGGGMMFAWTDEWFKPTWIVQYLESVGFTSGADFITTRQLWHNLCSPEQNFGLITFDQASGLDFSNYQLDNSAELSALQAASDNQYFHLSVEFPSDLSLSDTIWIAFDTYKKNNGESILPNSTHLTNRAEFCLQIPVKSDTAFYYVTQAYDCYGLTPRFLLADTLVQKFKSIVTNGKPWNLMRWKNEDVVTGGVQDIGKIRMSNTLNAIESKSLYGVFWHQNKLRVRIPWTMLYFSDPTQLEVVDGFHTSDGGWNWTPTRAKSDGIAVSVVKGSQVVNSTNRYTWPSWLIVPSTIEREKASLGIVRDGLLQFNDKL